MMSHILVQLGQIKTLVIGSVGICIALVNQHHQLNAQMFIEFSGRFQNILRCHLRFAGLLDHPVRFRSSNGSIGLPNRFRPSTAGRQLPLSFFRYYFSRWSPFFAL
jgi:hypothetical protein